MSGSDQHLVAAPGSDAQPRIELFDDWEHSLRPATTGETRVPLPESPPFRPLLRRPMALLHIVDNGRDDGEKVRMRGDRLVIGRSEGEVIVPHDISMSPRHAGIERLADAAWELSDLGSSSGTFVRVTSARLKVGGMFRLGGTVLQFHAVDVTEAWLVDVTLAGRGHRHECHAPTTTVGRVGSGCGVCLHDPFVSPLHAEVHRTSRGWRIDNAGASGLWVRIDAPVRMMAPSQFLCGEQRFVFEPLTR